MINFDFTDQCSVKKFTEEYSHNTFSQEVLGIKNYQNAIIIPNTNSTGGVYSDGNFIFNTSLHRNWVKNTEKNVKPKKISNERVVYLGCWHDIWGHCITDNLKHLWFMQNSEYEEIKKLKFVYISVFDNFNLTSNFISILEKLGINECQIEKITEATEFNNIYVPDECFYLDEFCDIRKFTKEYRQIIFEISKNVKPDKSNDKIYFSRTAIKNFKDFGEKQIENYMKDLGYFIIHPEQYSFEQQVAILKGCSFFCTTEGSISHNIVFCNENTKVLILRKDNVNINSYQTALNKFSEADITFINANKTRFLNKNHPWTGPFFLCVTNEMERYFKKRKSNLNLIKYVFFYIPLQVMRRILGK
ncbi:MAG: glycosyltransferase family 61 protein [Treponemataceae bacterium]